MTELELMANEEARHGNREALERLEAELREARMTELAALGQAQEAMMSDDLVKRLREGDNFERVMSAKQAADRIEELEAQLVKAVEWAEKVREYAISWDDKYLAERSNEILAELTGGNE